MSWRQGHDKDGSAEYSRERRTIPSVVEIAELFGELEVLATECQVSDALSYLRSAKRAFLTAKHDRPKAEQADVNYQMHEIDCDDVTY